MSRHLVSGSFDSIRSIDIRFLQEASKSGLVHVLLWSDELILKISGEPPKFPLTERQYYLNAVRYVDSVQIINDINRNALPDDMDSLIVREDQNTPEMLELAKQLDVELKLITHEQLGDFPVTTPTPANDSSAKKVVVTGCYDWFHTGHIRFFEEVSELGDLYVGLGNDANIEKLKGEGHPMFKEDERLFMVQSIKFVKEAFINSGDGLLDIVPELERIKPDMYAVNEDGHTETKRELCEQYGMEYVILKRTPAPGLKARSSTSLRGF